MARSPRPPARSVTPRRAVLLAGPALACGLVTLLAAGCYSARVQNIVALPGDPVEGEVTWVLSCEECHGADGRGTPDGTNVVAELHHSDAQLMTIILEGRNDMPAYEAELTDQAAADLLAFMRTLDD